MENVLLNIEDHTFNPQGFPKLMVQIIDRLIVRKKVALWEDYKTAKDDLLMEYKNANNAETYNAIEQIYTLFEKFTYLEDWYNEL